MKLTFFDTVKSFTAKDFLQTLFIILVLLSNFLSYKEIKISFLTFPVGVITIALSFIINCIYAELYSRIESLKLIYITIFCLFVASFIVYGLILIPSYNDSYTHYMYVMGKAPLVALADAICLGVAYRINTFVIEYTKKLGKNLFWIRSIVATVAGELAYNFIWVFIAYSPTKQPALQKIEIALSMITVKLILAIVLSIPGLLIILYFKRRSKPLIT